MMSNKSIAELISLEARKKTLDMAGLIGLVLSILFVIKGKYYLVFLTNIISGFVLVFSETILKKEIRKVLESIGE